jgi:CheY-like chemotaxis protein
MDRNFNIGHPFYFPTQVVLVDDDPDFLEGISLMLNKELSFKLFQSASAALKYVNEAHRHVDFVQRCYTSYKTGPQESDALSHIDIGKLHHEILNGFRFQTCSTVIVDYSMPEMNGLEFLKSLRNPFIRKVLLTGQADMELAIKAFNQQLIDQFIDKHDPRLKPKLNATIATFQDQYFRSSFKLITDPILTNNRDGFLTSPEFQEFFSELRKQTGCAEYYMLDTPHLGYLMVDAAGERRCLLVYSQPALDEHVEQLQEIGAPQELVAAVKCGQILPVYDAQAVPITPTHPFIAEWNDYYYPAQRINARLPYYTTITDAIMLPAIHNKPIHSYKQFLETSSIVQQIVH